MKRIKNILWISLMVFFLWTQPVWAEEATPASTEVTTDLLLEQLDLFDWSSIEKLEASLKASAPQMEGFDLKDQVIRLATGQERFSMEKILMDIGSQVVVEAQYYIRIIIRFILIVILCGFLQTLTTAFKSKEITKVAFFVCYLLIIYTVAQSLFMIVELAMTTIARLSEIMLVTLPTLLAFMAVSGYITSSSALAPVMIGVLNGVTFIIQKVILPTIVSILILQVISSMSEEIKVDKFVDLFYKAAKWGLRMAFVISVGIMGIYKLTLPTLDVALKKSALSLSSAFLPVVGDVGKGALEFVLLGAGLAKNAFAIGVMIWIIGIAALPLIRIFTYIAMYHIAAAIIQPVGDKKMSQIASILGKGCEFVLSCVGSVVILAIVVMLVCTSVGMSIT